MAKKKASKKAEPSTYTIEITTVRVIPHKSFFADARRMSDEHSNDNRDYLYAGGRASYQTLDSLLDWIKEFMHDFNEESQPEAKMLLKRFKPYRGQGLLVELCDNTNT